MANLVINDLDRSTELDRSALQTLCGGAFDLSSFDALMSNVKLGDLSSAIDVNANGNVLSPMVITALDLYIPVTTVVQLDLDNIIATEEIIASSIGAAPTE